MNHVGPQPRESRDGRFGIGQAVRRVEDRRFLMGRGRYVDDINLPGQLHAAVVRSPHAHARIVSVQTAAAAGAPGVVCVLTGSDVEGDHLQGLTASAMPEDVGAQPGHRTFRPALVGDKARFVGDGVAIVLADTAGQARDAAELVEVDYQPLPAVVELDDAVAHGAPRVHDDCPNGNVAWSLMFGSEAAADAAFAAAPRAVRLRLVNNRVTANAIEPRGALGEFDPASDSYTLHTSTQNPHGVRQQVAGVLNIPETRLRVVGPDVGGGFGVKSDPYPEDVLVLWASRRCGRPVKWTATRFESLLSDSDGRDQVVEGELAFDDEGRILAIRARALNAVGAYLRGRGLFPSVNSLRFIPGAYDVQAVHVMTRGVFTNTAPVGPYRGAGRPEATYVTERLLDAAATELGVDPAEIRRRNLIRPEALPYLTSTSSNYDSGDFPRVLDRCLALADWDGFLARRATTEARGLLRGRAVSYFIDQGGVSNDRMELRFDPGGTVTIVAGTFSHGQGHATTYGQMVTEWLGVPFEGIRFVQGDTDQVPFGRGTYAARSSMIGGSALRRAADGVIERAKPMAAELLEAAVDDIEFAAGVFRVVGTDRTIPLIEVARAFYHPTGVTDRFGVGLEASGTWSTNPANFPNGCHACEVEVDPETGEVVVDRYTTVDDAGRVINPLICEGQVQGGLAQGLGQALLEHVVYDRESGQLATGTLGDYGMPRAEFMPATLTSAFEEIPCTTNPLGVKGIGEASTVGAPPTVINAILDALRPLGVKHLDMPATPVRVWEAIVGARLASP
jgi:carbon-monoxide dehydrogenase large subunit